MYRVMALSTEIKLIAEFDYIYYEIHIVVAR